VIQVNGKVRAKAMVPAGLPDDELKKIALEDPKIKALSEEKPIKKVFVVRGRLVNLVV
jgi:leucyl-tRNA synthetase